MASQLFYLARHGQTDWNAGNRWQGWTDIPLNAIGRAQARILAAAVRGLGPIGVVSSDLSRARETAQIVADSIGLPFLEADPDLRERGFGVFEGLTRQDCERDHAEAWRRWHDGRHLPEGAERTEDVAVRFLRALDRVGRRVAESGAPILVVAHGGAMRVAVHAATGRFPPPVANGEVWRIEWDERVRAAAEVAQTLVT